MKNLIGSELERIFSSKKTKVTFIVSMILLILILFFVKIGETGFYDPKISVKLNSLNFAPFILREFHMVLAIIICPMLFTESFNSERTNGYYRMIMIRPYSKLQMFLSKWISQAITFGILILITFIITIVFGYLALPEASEANFFNIAGSFSKTGALLFNFKFYLCEYLVILAILSINALMGVLMPNSVLAFIGSVGVCLGSLYIVDKLEFLIFSTKGIFDILSGISMSVLLYSLLIIIIGFLSGMVLFVSIDYKC